MFARLRYRIFVLKRMLLNPLRHRFPSILNRVDNPTRTAVICKNCSRYVQARIYHSGFSETLPLYCSNCEAVLLIDYCKVQIDDLLPPSDQLPPGDWGKWGIPYWQKVENLFKNCPSGGYFGYLNPPRCPYCRGLVAGDTYEGKAALKKIDRNFLVFEKAYDGHEMLKDSERKRIIR